MQQCPHAVPMYSLASNATVLINQAPPVCVPGLLALNKRAPQAYKSTLGQAMAVISGAGSGLTVSAVRMLHARSCWSSALYLPFAH